MKNYSINFQMLSKVLKISIRSLVGVVHKQNNFILIDRSKKKAKSNGINEHCTTKYKLTFLSEDELKTVSAILSGHQP